MKSMKPMKAGNCAICGMKVTPGVQGHNVIVRRDNSRFYFHTNCTGYMKEKEGEK